MVRKYIENFPNDIIKNQNKRENNIIKKDNNSLKKEQNQNAWLGLFFSFDIVNSTKYKTLTTQWPTIIETLLKYIQDLVKYGDQQNTEDTPLSLATLWRVIGDEIIFYIKISNLDELKDAIDYIFEIIQKISLSLKSGKFNGRIENQDIVKNEIEIIKIQNNLSIKSAAWVAPINKTNINPYDNILSSYDSVYADNKVTVLEFIGKDIDTGFRIKGEALPRKLIISLEIAYLLKIKHKSDIEDLKKHTENLNKYKVISEKYEEISDEKFYEKFIIMDYKQLKGVFDESPYPLIFYHNSEKTINEKRVQEEISFDESFDYDEPQMIEIVNNYFARNIKETNNKNEFLNKDMYDSKIAIDKIIKSKYLYDKLEYLEEICPLRKLNLADNKKIEGGKVSKIELHCTVVCCDIESEKILIAKRNKNHKTNPGIWDFGCSKAESGEKLIDSIKKQYKKRFNIDIELYTDSDRKDVQPVPLHIYELGKYENKKGIIFAAKVLNQNKENLGAEFKAGDKYVELKWINREDIENLKNKGEKLVSDFENTANKVFDNMDKWFPEGEDNE